MSNDALTKAEAAVREAQTDTVAVQLALAAVELAKTAAAQQQAVVPQPVAPAPRRPVGLYVAAGIGGAVALSFLAMAAALLAVAVAVGGTCATVCLLVLRSMWRDYNNR